MRIRALLTAFLLLLTTAAWANDSKVALSAEGVLYSIDTQPYEINGAVGSRLVLIEQRAGKSTSIVLPSTAIDGHHGDAALAFDNESDTLFIFWKKMPNPFSSELLFCSYKDNEFSEPFSIENASFHLRSNLQITVTHWEREQNPDDTWSRRRRLNVHAVWWDQTSGGQEARYAMIGVNDGEVDSIFVSDLLDFVGDHRNPDPFDLPTEFDTLIFRASGVSPTSDQGGIQVTFGDWEGKRFQNIEIYPVASDGVLHVPLGVWRGDINPPSRSFENIGSNSLPSILHGPSGSRGVVFYLLSEDKLEYTLLSAGEWSETRTINLGERIGRDFAMAGVRNLLAASE